MCYNVYTFLYFFSFIRKSLLHRFTITYLALTHKNNDRTVVNTFLWRTDVCLHMRKNIYTISLACINIKIYRIYITTNNKLKIVSVHMNLKQEIKTKKLKGKQLYFILKRINSSYAKRKTNWRCMQIIINKTI